MSKCVVSIMMPAYNAERYIGQAIDSVLTQTFADWELVVVNDGSQDRTREIVTAYADARIRFFDQPNGGEAAARNTALSHMRGEYVAFLDADDCYEPDHLAQAIGYLEAHPEDDGVYTDGFYITADGARLNTLSSRRRGPYTGHIFAEVVYGSDLFGPPLCVVLRREPILRHNLRYDPNIVIGPDWVFFMQYAEVASFGYLDRMTCRYRIHQTNISLQVDRERRALELAKCRVRAIELESFPRCPVDVRTNVFHDLLVTLLNGFPERQAEIIRLSQFLALPDAEQARLLRLMASRALQTGKADRRHIQEWLERARELNSADRRGNVLAALHGVSPALCRFAVQVRTLGRFDPLSADPFIDLQHR